MHSLDIVMGLWIVDLHVELAECDLSESENSLVELLCSAKILGQRNGNFHRRLCGVPLFSTAQPVAVELWGDIGVVAAEPLKAFGCPAPILQQLTGCFSEVGHSAVAVEHGVFAFTYQVVNPFHTGASLASTESLDFML